MAPTPDLKYEDALKRLEKLVAELEHSELDLETRLKKFEEGTKLARLLLKKLDQAKKKVQVLVKTHAGGEALESFHDDKPDDDSLPDAPAAD